MGCAVMRLQDGTRDHFMKFIGERFPSMLPAMTRLYGRTEAPTTYRKEVQAMVRVLQERYGVRGRDEDSPTASAPDRLPEQAAFAW